MSYTPPSANEANLTLQEEYTPPSAVQADLILGRFVEVRVQSTLYQIWTDDNYVYCATADGLGIIPIGG